MNIQKFLTDAEENFSGFNGDGFANDLDFDGGFYEDDYYGATGTGQAGVSPAPYQVTITNTNGTTANAVLFGYNKYLLTSNFGSDTGVTVTPSQSNVTYLELLQQSAGQPFETSLIRIQSSNTSQITQVLTITSKDANGQQCLIPLITQSYFSANQFQSTILDVPYSLTIDANTYITIPVLATTTVVFTFFPAEKINPARNLGGKPQAKPYGAPSVAIGIPTVPVRPAIARR
jgi:hypothetical protein